jgi:hypothetical protein
MDHGFRSDFDPMAIFWWCVSISSTALLAVAVALILYCLLYPIAAEQALRDSMKKDEFFDWKRAKPKRK